MPQMPSFAGYNSHAEGPLLAGPMLGEVGHLVKVLEYGCTCRFLIPLHDGVENRAVTSVGNLACEFCRVRQSPDRLGPRAGQRTQRNKERVLGSLSQQ